MKHSIPTIPFDPEIVAKLDKILVENPNIPIEGVPPERVVEIRRMVRDNCVEGIRSDWLVPILQKEFGIEKKKAGMIAHRQVSLFISKYKEYKDKKSGWYKYRWLTSNDEGVCKRCRALDKKIFRFDDPPPGGNPGECPDCPDKAGCRCVASPILSYGGIEDEDEDRPFIDPSPKPKRAATKRRKQKPKGRIGCLGAIIIAFLAMMLLSALGKFFN
jgi:SPP1 gp7 family putative phage head morphogenesis protein